MAADARSSPSTWRTSTKSSYGTCVEVRFLADSVEVRHSCRPEGSTLVFTVTEWEAFLAGAAEHEFDHPAHARGA